TRSQKEQNVAVCRPSLTATVLGICLLFGQGFRAPNFAFESFGRSLKNYITSSAPIDAAFTSAERLVRVQNKAPRRQVSFGAVPPNSMLEVPAACGRRTIVETRCPSSATPTRQSDRAPPPLNA